MGATAVVAGPVAPGPPRSGPLRRNWLWPHVRSNLWLTGAAAGAVVVQVVADLALVLLLSAGLDRAVQQHDLALLNVLCLGYLGIAVLSYAADVAETRLSFLAGQRVLFSVRTALLDHVLGLSLSYYERERAGGVVARITNDVAALGEFVTRGLVILVANVATVGGIVVVLLVLDVGLAGLAFAAVPVLVLAVRAFRRRSGPAYEEVRAAAADATVRGQAALTGLAAVQAYRLEDRVLADVDGANARERLAERRTVRLGALFFPTVEFLGAASVAVVLAVGGLRVLDGSVTVGTLAALVFYLRRVYDPITELSQAYDMAQAAAAAAHRIGATFRERSAVPDPPDPVPLPAAAGDVELAGVRFGSGVRPVLHDVSLRLPAGKVVALVGPTGAGKSTIVKLVARFYDPAAGEIRLDGVDLRRLDRQTLRGAVLHVPQEVFLRSGTVADNVRYGRPSATDEEVEEALMAIGGRSLLDALPDGSRTEVGDRGAGVSAGQRQLVALARAWLADPPVLLMDEAASDLDAAAEQTVYQALRQRRCGRTTMMVAHRLGPVLKADTVVVVVDGGIEQVGPPAALRSRPGYFADLCAAWDRGRGGG